MLTADSRAIQLENLDAIPLSEVSHLTSDIGPLASRVPVSDLRLPPGCHRSCESKIRQSRERRAKNRKDKEENRYLRSDLWILASEFEGFMRFA